LVIFEEEESEFDKAYEIFKPKTIDWKELIDSAQSFPKNLFPDNMGSLRELKDDWDKMIAIVRKDDLEVMKTRAIETFTERISKENYRGASNLSYIDKSGYRVNLSRYFTKLLEIPPKVPAAVTAAYNENFKYIEEESKKIVELIKQYVADQKWSEVKRLSSLLNDYGTKQFNNEVEKYLKEESYDRKKEGSFSTKITVTHIERFAS
jgi:DNA-directed RNA polymerase subunit F